MKLTKPEKKFELDVRAWAFSKGIWLEVYDSKAKHTEKGFYRAQGMPVGTPDLMGFNKYGRGVHIEIKAPGGNPIPSLEQRNHIARAIEYGCFGAIVNDVNTLANMYERWLMITDEPNKRAYLLGKLPHKVKIKGKIVELGDRNG